MTSPSWTGAMILPQTPHKNLPKNDPERLVLYSCLILIPATPQFLPPLNSKNYFSATFIYIHHYYVVSHY